MEEKKITMKKIIFADFVEYNCKTSKLGNYHLCNCFVKDGYEALWLSNSFNQLIYFKNREDYYLKKSISSSKRHKLAENIYGFAPYSMRLYGNYIFSRSENILRNFQKYILPDIKETFKKIDFYEVDILWISNPKFFWLANVVKYKKLIYRMADDYTKFKEYPNIKEIEKEFIRKADVVFITSSKLKHKVETLGVKPYLLNNGVFFEHFNKRNIECPKEFNNKCVKRIIYIGAIKYWFDVNLVKELAECTSADIFIIGMRQIDLSDIASKENVHILGARGYDELPGYLKYSDVAIIPFIRSSMTDSISPLKLYEYCSAGVAVVSSYMEDISKLGAPIYIAKDKNDFIHGVKRCLKEGCDKEQLINFGKQNSWDSRFEFLKEIISM